MRRRCGDCTIMSFSSSIPYPFVPDGRAVVNVKSLRISGTYRDGECFVCRGPVGKSKKKKNVDFSSHTHTRQLR